METVLVVALVVALAVAIGLAGMALRSTRRVAAMVGKPATATPTRGATSGPVVPEQSARVAGARAGAEAGALVERHAEVARGEERLRARAGTLEQQAASSRWPSATARSSRSAISCVEPSSARPA